MKTNTSKKVYWLVTLLLVIAMFATACGNSNGNTEGATDNQPKEEATKEPAATPAPEPAEEPAKTFTLKWSTASVPNDTHTKAMEVFKE